MTQLEDPPARAPADDRLAPPPRWRRPSALVFTGTVAGLALFVHGLVSTGLVSSELLTGIGRIAEFLGDAIPPDPTRLGDVVAATLETLEMAVVGTAIGAVASLPLALLAARNTSPSPPVYGAARGFIALLRSIPDLVWGLIFVVAVGLGPEAGILAIAVDTIGFCGRLFAERIEELDPRPVAALHATGASTSAVIGGAILPAAFPSFVATTLFSLESATRSAVVLGLVGAGGIGIELSTSMSLLRYDEAATIIIVIFVVVLAVERFAAAIRRQLLT